MRYEEIITTRVRRAVLMAKIVIHIYYAGTDYGY